MVVGVRRFVPTGTPRDRYSMAPLSPSSNVGHTPSWPLQVDPDASDLFDVAFVTNYSLDYLYYYCCRSLDWRFRGPFLYRHDFPSLPYHHRVGLALTLALLRREDGQTLLRSL